MFDFTPTIYSHLISSLSFFQYEIYTFDEYLKLKNKNKKLVILRHDVDRKPQRALTIAKIEKILRVKSSYYFRIIKKSKNNKIIKEIASMGHEIGYHYEDLSLKQGNPDKAIESFQKNLEYFRQFYPVKTICMHGSPLSKWDNRDLWNEYNYRDYGIIGEPYFDIDFNEFLYLTDTGRRWDGSQYIVRDKVNSAFKMSFKTTHQIIYALEKNKLPNKIMITTHPERWNDKFLPWTLELLLQNIKNVIKKFYYVKRTIHAD